MADDTLTIALEGEVTLDAFTDVLRHFRTLVTDLSKEVGNTPIDWRIENLEIGSAIITTQGRTEDTAAILRVGAAYTAVGRALQQRTTIPYSARIQRSAERILKQIGGPITSIRFETSQTEVVIGSNPDIMSDMTIVYAYGQVRGRVDTLTRRGQLRFTLYDLLFDRPISCYLVPEQEEQMRRAWGRRVAVSGRIGREPTTYHPVVIRDITELVLLPDPHPEGYQAAQGAISPTSDSPLSEIIIRSMRDAGTPPAYLLG